jgi:hypothetical protein
MFAEFLVLAMQINDQILMGFISSWITSMNKYNKNPPERLE